jgi:hypothetical protein
MESLGLLIACIVNKHAIIADIADTNGTLKIKAFFR